MALRNFMLLILLVEACDWKYYGVDCVQKCSGYCHNQECDPTNGRCFRCIPGRRGDFCHLASDSGYYGENCTHKCSNNCADKKCFSTNGHCFECSPGKTGHFCRENCSPGTFGNGCQSNCSLGCAKDGLCHPVNGTCDDGCIAGFRGDLCDIEISTTPVVVQQECSETKPIFCPKSGICCSRIQFCDFETGTCQECFPLDITERMDRLALCRELGLEKTNRRLRHSSCVAACSSLFSARELAKNIACDWKYYGVNCSQKCSGYCHNQECDSTNGRCFRCIPGRRGDFCQLACDSGYYGENCTHKCSNNCADKKCFSTNGHCFECSPGKTGHFCRETCDPTHYGVNCLQVCSHDCYNQTCNSISGHCYTCWPGRIGNFCELARTTPDSTFIEHSISTSPIVSLNDSYGTQSSNGDKNALIVGFTIAVFIAMSSVLVWYIRRRIKDKPANKVSQKHGSLEEKHGTNVITDEEIYSSIDEGPNRTSRYSGINHYDVIDQLSLQNFDGTVNVPYLPPRPVQQQYIELALVPIERNKNNIEDVLINADEGNEVSPSPETDTNIDGDIPTTLPASVHLVVDTLRDGCVNSAHCTQSNMCTPSLDEVHNPNKQSLAESTIKSVNNYDSVTICETTKDENHYNPFENKRRDNLDLINKTNNEEYITPSQHVIYVDTPTLVCVPSKLGIEYVDNQLSEVSINDTDILSDVAGGYLMPVEGKVMTDCIMADYSEKKRCERSINVDDHSLSCGLQEEQYLSGQKLPHTCENLIKDKDDETDDCYITPIEQDYLSII